MATFVAYRSAAVVTRSLFHRSMAKLKLEMEPDPAVTVIGISSHVNDYRLCWSINRALNLSLTRRRVGIKDEGEGHGASFSAYDHEVEGTQERITLINNHCGDGILIREQKQADFFLVMDDTWARLTPDLMERIRSADLVQMAFPLVFDKLKDGYKLLL